MRCRRHRQRQRMVRPSPWSGCVVASVRPSAPWRCASTAPVSAAVARAQSAPATVIEGGARQPLPHVLAQERQQRRRQVGTLRQHCHARADPSGLGKGTITVHRRKEARSRCTVCATTFSARRGTMVYRKKTPVDLLVPVVTLLSHGRPVSAMVAAFGLQAETVRT